MRQVIAIDWSGRREGEARTIWLARVVDGNLVELENGRTRAEVVARLIQLADEAPRTLAGLDFAFSFPRWYCDRRGWADGPAVWRAMHDHGERLLRETPEPFWGRPGSRRQTTGPGMRETDAPPAKSVFQIGGAGSVGTGSIRGMPHLLTLREAGFAIWPFDPPGDRTVVEMYPRRLTGPVRKSDARARREYLDREFPGVTARAAETEDAFDAAVSALRMAARTDPLPAVAPDDPRRIEGAIWP